MLGITYKKRTPKDRALGLGMAFLTYPIASDFAHRYLRARGALGTVATILTGAALITGGMALGNYVSKHWRPAVPSKNKYFKKIQ